jgi:2-polyprenyl-3-methyl-5-hydroxy-6-metoxy-1,4-benzoquinol methylase
MPRVIKVKREQVNVYYRQVRKDILALLPPSFSPQNILDVGCGAGNTSAYLKEKFPAAHATGIEVHAPAALLAKTRLDRVIEASVEAADLPLPESPFDLILCLDVLEHLNDPWAALAKFAEQLAEGGFVLISLPNIQNLKVLINLVKGKWVYKDSGIMDRTHLRFFTYASVMELVHGAGLQPVIVKHSMGQKMKVMNALTLGIFKNFLAFQIHVLAEKLKC